MTAVFVLGIGIGVNNMLFTILNAHTIRGLPIPQSGRVFFISSVDDQGADRGVSFADFEDITTLDAPVRRDRRIPRHADGRHG